MKTDEPNEDAMRAAPALCRRCGERRDENHVPSPYLCRMGDPAEVQAKLMRAKLRIVQMVAVILAFFAIPALAQRRVPTCSAEAISLSVNWRASTSDGCTAESREERCWIDATSGAPLWTVGTDGKGNASCQMITRWLAQKSEGNYVRWLVNQWTIAMQRGEDPGYDVPAPICTHHGYTITVEPGAAFGHIDVWDERDPFAVWRVQIPQRVPDSDAEFLYRAFTSGSFDTSLQLGCWRTLRLAPIPGVTITRRASVEMAGQ